MLLGKIIAALLLMGASILSMLQSSRLPMVSRKILAMV